MTVLEILSLVISIVGLITSIVFATYIFYLDKEIRKLEKQKDDLIELALINHIENEQDLEKMRKIKDIYECDTIKALTILMREEYENKQ